MNGPAVRALLRLADRDALRHKGRSFLIVLTLTFPVAGLVAAVTPRARAHRAPGHQGDLADGHGRRHPCRSATTRASRPPAVAKAAWRAGRACGCPTLVYGSGISRVRGRTGCCRLADRQRPPVHRSAGCRHGAPAAGSRATYRRRGEPSPASLAKATHLTLGSQLVLRDVDGGRTMTVVGIAEVPAPARRPAGVGRPRTRSPTPPELGAEPWSRLPPAPMPTAGPRQLAATANGDAPATAVLHPPNTQSALAASAEHRPQGAGRRARAARGRPHGGCRVRRGRSPVPARPRPAGRDRWRRRPGTTGRPVRRPRPRRHRRRRRDGARSRRRLARCCPRRPQLHQPRVRRSAPASARADRRRAARRRHRRWSPPGCRPAAPPERRSSRRCSGRRGIVRTSRTRIGLALTTAAVGTLCCAWAGRSHSLGGQQFNAILLFAAIAELGFAGCAPSLVGLTGRLGGRAPLTMRLSLRDISRNRSRTGPAVAAIMATLSGVVAMGVYTASQHARHVADFVPTLPAQGRAVPRHRYASSSRGRERDRRQPATPPAVYALGDGQAGTSTRPSPAHTPGHQRQRRTCSSPARDC